MYEDTTVLISTRENHFTEKDVIKGGKGSFNVAFGLVSYDQADQDTDYSEYGQLRARLKRWGSDFDGV